MKRNTTGSTTVFCTLLAALFMTGCSTVAPAYPPSLTNVAALKASGPATAKVSAFASASDPGNANPISIRGGSMNSPYAGSYANYVAEAIKQELILAGKYAPNADVDISGTLLSNDLDASGFSTGHGNISMRVVVKNHGVVTFDKVKATKHEWESSFAGPVAIPRAIGAYPVMVQNLLALLYADPDFTTALK